MIYKVSEVVKELGVSRQTVYKKLRREAYKPYIVEVDGVTGVTEEGLLMLKGIKDIDSDVVNEKEMGNNTEVTGVTDSVSKLQEQLIDSLHKQLEVKDKQLQEKDAQINSLLKITENGQVLQKMILNNTEIKLLAYREELEERRKEHQKKEEKGLLNKIKNYFNK
ncbi:MAG: hypothetical protein ACRCX7_07335 [Cetobacterium sp.]|uniref:hypothetical protein n=1 Tax=Cetobacterium sp. TaxID=2071632 RepID=UPI003F360B58